MFFLSQFFFPYTLIKFDIEKEEPIRNSEGLCIVAARGELVPLAQGCRIFENDPFLGLVGRSDIACYGVGVPFVT